MALSYRGLYIVFQPELDILGMVIYATEFVLWCGVFGCGGYFNLIPWVRQKMSIRAQKKLDERRNETQSCQQEMGAEGVSNDVELRQIPSSTSVFLTPSSVSISRSSVRSEERMRG